MMVSVVGGGLRIIEERALEINQGCVRSVSSDFGATAENLGILPKGF